MNKVVSKKKINFGLTSFLLWVFLVLFFFTTIYIIQSDFPYLSQIFIIISIITIVCGIIGLIKREKFALLGLVLGTLSFLILLVMLTVITNIKKSAKDSGFIYLSSEVKDNVMMCCDKNGQLTTNIGGELCSIPGVANWPDKNKIGKIEIIKNCQNGTFEYSITPGKENKGHCEIAVCNDSQYRCTFDESCIGK